MYIETVYILTEIELSVIRKVEHMQVTILKGIFFISLYHGTLSHLYIDFYIQA